MISFIIGLVIGAALVAGIAYREKVKDFVKAVKDKIKKK